MHLLVYSQLMVLGTQDVPELSKSQKKKAKKKSAAARTQQEAQGKFSSSWLYACCAMLG